MNSTDMKIAIMQAYSEGKSVEVKRRNHLEWSIAGIPSWNWEDFEYRVKQTKTVYKLTYPDGSVSRHRDIDDAIKQWRDSAFNPTLQKIEE